MGVLRAAGLALVVVLAVTAAHTQTAALTGVVSSAAEPRMEGVLVSATRAGSPITVTVVSDGSGRYTFPRERLEPGAYTLRVRAIGYELERPATATVSAQPATLDLALRTAQDVPSQLSNGEWLMSWPGRVEMKNGLLNCTQCHGLEPIARSRFTADEWVGVLERMARYAQGSTRQRPQLRPGSARGSAILAQSMAGREGERPVQAELVTQTADYLATVNLDLDGHWSYPFQTLPRPRGAATRVVVTEYALPRPEALPRTRTATSGTRTLAPTCSARSIRRRAPWSSTRFRSPSLARRADRSTSCSTSRATSGWARCTRATW
jgi:hypothetical protein